MIKTSTFTFLVILDIVLAHGCIRQKQLKNVGYDLSGLPVVVDVGKCVASAGNDFDDDQYISVLQRILIKSEEQNVCKYQDDESMECGAISFAAKYLENLQADNKFVEAIRECGCKKTQKKCAKVPKNVLFFEGTKQEMNLDVGACEGGKTNDGRVCQATAFSPNKLNGRKHEVATVTSCGMKHDCKRRRNNIIIRMKRKTKTGRRVYERKVIDIGKCGGKCGHRNKCVFGNSRGCIASLKSSELTCTPSDTRQMSFINMSGNVEHITKILSCKCT